MVGREYEYYDVVITRDFGINPKYELLVIDTIN